MLPICRDDYFISVSPRIVREGKETQIRIQILDRHICLEEGKTYRIAVIPMNSKVSEKAFTDAFETTAIAQDHALCFSHAFLGEQEHSIRIYAEGEETPVIKTSVYSLKEDLFARRPYLGDFHVHSCISDGVETPAFVAAMYRQAGFDFMALTDHGDRSGSVKAVDFYKEIPMDFQIYYGEEVHAPGNLVHIVNFGCDSSVNEVCYAEGDEPWWAKAGNPEWNEAVWKRMENLPELPEYIDPFTHASCLEVFDAIRRSGGMSILCHPFWIYDIHNVSDAMTRFYLENGFADAFELLGGQTNHENMMQLALYHDMIAKGCRIPIVGSSDSHGTADHVYFEGTKTMVFADANTRDGIVNAVKNGYSVAMEEYTGQEPRYYSSFRMVSYAMFLYEHYFPLHQELCFEEGRLMRAASCGDEKAVEKLAALEGRTIEHMENMFAK